jgi:hypothetical protein
MPAGGRYMMIRNDALATRLVFPPALGVAISGIYLLTVSRPGRLNRSAFDPPLPRRQQAPTRSRAISAPILASATRLAP